MSRPRIRTVKPDFFQHEGLFDLEQETGLPIRVSFAGLWTCSDREGRFHYRPRQLKANILPYDDVDMGCVLHALVRGGFIKKYEIAGETYGCIPSWHRHQVINNREAASEIPEPPSDQQIVQAVGHACGTRDQRVHDACTTREERVMDACTTESGCGKAEGKGKEGKGTEVTPLPVPREAPVPDDSEPADPRHARTRQLIQQLHLQTFGVRCQWDGSEAKALDRLLTANPSWTCEQTAVMVRNRFASEGIDSSRPRQWLPNLGRYAGGALDRFNRLKGANGNGNRAEQRQANNLAALEAAFPLDR